MRALVPALFLAASFGGPHGGGCDCGHMGSDAHGGSVGHGSFSNVHLPISSSVAHASSGGAVTHASPAVHHHFGATLATGIRRALAAGAQVIEGVLGLAPESDEEPAAEPPLNNRACQSVEDCGEGVLGQGAVCDHWSQEPRAMGICRDACRDDRDCPAPFQCQWALDPADPSWGGCVE